LNVVVPAPVSIIKVLGVADDELLPRLAEAGLTFTADEARRVADLLGRDPTVVEANIFNTMWSEHCSYKSSRKVLGEYLPTEGVGVVLGPGEDAGIVRLATVNGKSYCIAIAHESHNHPSQVVPNEGAATGIGGIVRDVYCMGADVIGVLDPLRFGDPTGKNAERTKEIVHGVVEGIWQYGNALGVPNLGGDVYFDSSFDENCLVNVVALGLVVEDEIIRSRIPVEARDTDYDVILVGKPTDPSGFGGATFASRVLDEERALDDKYAVQVPDPFLKRMLAVATRDVLKLARDRGAAIGCKDLGAGGIACATSELGAAAGLGVRIDLSRVIVAEDNLKPEVIACSETQERYSFVVPRELSPEVLRIYNEVFDLPEICHGSGASVIGKVIQEARFILEHEGAVVCDARTEEITAGICYMRESRPREFTPRECVLPDGLDVRGVLLEVLGAVNVASREHIYRHYDSEVKGSTVVRPGEADAGVIAPIPGAGVGVAVACDGNPFYGAVDSYQAGAVAVAESVRNVAAVGAHPIALTDCLNFGNPEVPEVFHDFVEAVRGIGDAARGIGLKDSGEPIPVVSGNVSFYNQSSGGSAVLPSPIVCCVGRLVDVSCHLTMGLKADGNSIYLLGRRTARLGASALLRTVAAASPRTVAGDQVAPVPEVDFDDERRMMVAVTDIAESGLAASCHDISDGGVAVALAEMVLSSPQDAPVGARVSVQRLSAAETGASGAASGTTHDLELLFSEAGGYLLEVAIAHEERLLKILEDRGVWYSRIGTTVADGGLSFTETADRDFSLSAEELARPWTDGATEVMR